MERAVEIYLRPSGDRILLNIYVPKALVREFIRSLNEGTFCDPAVPVAFEMSVQRNWYSGIGEDHIRVPITAINLIEADDE